MDSRASLQAAGQAQCPTHLSFLSVTESDCSVSGPHSTPRWTGIWADSVAFRVEKKHVNNKIIQTDRLPGKMQLAQ